MSIFFYVENKRANIHIARFFSFIAAALHRFCGKNPNFCKNSAVTLRSDRDATPVHPREVSLSPLRMTAFFRAGRQCQRIPARAIISGILASPDDLTGRSTSRFTRCLHRYFTSDLPRRQASLHLQKSVAML
ncbi:MAG: hypothetical protein VB055_10285 [Oscillospiraceae bacterium]|nr:hypothetical protein [Oscillospiraceae bacterium]